MVDFIAHVFYTIVFYWFKGTLMVNPKQGHDLGMMCKLWCFNVILCGVWTTIGVGINVVTHNSYQEY